MRTYRAGSLTLTNASTTIVGVGTAFIANVAVGDIVVIENGQCLEVVAVPDDTHITVSSPAKQSGSFNYAILRFVMAVNFRDLSIKIEQFLADRQFSLNEFSDWMSGTRTGGPNGDGRYPMTDRNKVTKLFMCPELIAFGYQDSLDQAAAAAASAVAADGSKTAAAGSATAAAGSATTAAGSASAANTSKVAAGVSETAAAASKDAAATSATNSANSATASAGSATAAANSATATATGVTAAANSATAASTSAGNAANSAAAADSSKTAAALSATNASTSATNASTSAAAALASKNAAATSETNAGASESAANTSKNAAAGSATAAAGSASAANTSKVNAATSETNAASSASAANTSKVNAGTSETNAAASATAALASKNAAATSATNAATSETGALASKNAAASSETAANASKNAAATSATNAATSETNSGANATAAAGSASAALVSKNAAAVSEANALASATSAAAGSLSGLDKMPSNLISNPTFISTASLFTTDVANGTVSYVDSTDASVPVGCPVTRVGKSLKKVAGQLLSHSFPLANAAPRIPCVPGEKFDVCIWMNVVGGLSTGNACARLVCVESNAVTGGTFVANTGVLSYDQALGGWQKLTGTFTASASTRSFNLGVWNETAMPVNGTIFFGEPELTRRNSIMGLLGSMGFGSFDAPLVTDLNANTAAGPLQCIAAAATAAGLPNNVGHNGVQLRQSATSSLQIVSPVSATASVGRKLFWRNSYNGTWSAWSEVAAANGGTLIDTILTGKTTFANLTTNAADDTVVPSSDGSSTVTPAVRASGNASNGANAVAAQGYSNTTASSGSAFVGTRSYGAVGAHGAVASGRSVCTLMGAASDGTTYRKVGRIDLYTEEAATATSSAGSVRILTTPVGSVTPALTATFTSDGRLVVAGGGSFGGNLVVTGDLSVSGGKSITSDYRMGVSRYGAIPSMTFTRADLADGAAPAVNSTILLIDGKTGVVSGDFASGRTLGQFAVNYNSTGGGTATMSARNAAGNVTTQITQDGDAVTVSIAGTMIALGKIDARGAIDEALTVTIASNTTTNIATAAANSIIVTGTTAIGALGTATAGVRRIVKFAGSLILANNATSLILPTGANITTAANDTAEFLSLGSGNWLCTAYNRVSGKPLNMENVDNTSDLNKPVSTATQTALTNGLAGKQGSLGYSPVQQGTGVGQLANVVKIGWSSAGKVKVTVDATDMGNVTFENVRHLSPNFEASAYTEAKGFASQATTDAPFVIKTQTLNAASEYIPMIKMRATFAGGAEAISMGVLSDPTVGQSLAFHWAQTSGLGPLLTMRRDGTAAQFSGSINAVTSVNASGSMSAGTTVNATGGCYNNGQMTWSRGDFNPAAKLDGNVVNNQPGSAGRYNMIVGPSYMNFTADQQVYCGNIELREAALVAAGGPSPGHMYNAPGISFHWAGYTVQKLMIAPTGNLCWGNPSNTFAQITVEGNIYGTTWGGYLSTWLNTYVLTTDNFRTRIADIRSGELGSYAIAVYVGGAVGINNTVVGSSLRYSSSNGSNPGGALPGNWDCCGYISASLENTLWHRYV